MDVQSMTEQIQFSQFSEMVRANLVDRFSPLYSIG